MQLRKILINLIVLAQVSGLSGMNLVTYWYNTDKNLITNHGIAYTSHLDKKENKVTISIDNDFAHYLNDLDENQIEFLKARALAIHALLEDKDSEYLRTIKQEKKWKYLYNFYGTTQIISGITFYMSALTSCIGAGLIIDTKLKNIVVKKKYLQKVGVAGGCVLLSFGALQWLGKKYAEACGNNGKLIKHQEEIIIDKTIELLPLESKKSIVESAYTLQEAEKNFFAENTYSAKISPWNHEVSAHKAHYLKQKLAELQKN